MLPYLRIRRELNSGVPGLVGKYDGSNISTITKAYQNLVATGSGTISTTTITASSTVANLVQAGMKLRIGGTDIYTVANVVTTTITTVETLTATYGAGSAMALDRVSQWNDLSGLGNHLTQGTALVQPIYNPAQLNSKSVITFDGASRFTTPASLHTIANGNNTMFAVSKTNTNGTGLTQSVIAFTEGGASRCHLVYGGTVGQFFYASNAAGTGLQLTATPDQTIWATWYGRRSGTTQAIAHNNGTENTSASGSDENGIDLGQVGARNSLVHLTGSIAELRIYNRSLTRPEVIQVNREIAQSWALTIS